jgi:amino-acid N-acetyltransferase
MAMTTTRTDQTVSLRPAAGRDLPAVERLLTASSLPLTGVAENLESFVVAETGAGELVGVAGLELCCNNALLRSVAVDAAWRRHGVGRQLVERVIADAESRGVRALYLLTTTAEHYFPSFGFTRTTRDAVPEEVRATAEFQGACPASAVVMSRELVAVSA